MNRKSLTTFLLITFSLAWILFIIPLAFKNTPNTYVIAMQVCFMVAMWAPGLAAIISTRFVEQRPVISALHINALGPKRFYLVAWFLPALMIVVTIGVSALLGTGTIDTNLTVFRESLAQVPPEAKASLPPVELLALIQTLFALILAPFINVLFAFGEELGWRGFLLLRLMPLGQWKAILLSGVIWGLWHAPTTFFHGYNFPQHPYLGVLVMTLGCTLFGVILSWLTLKTRSPWVAGLGHGAFNATAGLSFFFLKPGFDSALAGSPLGMAGWVTITVVIAILIWTRQLPVSAYPMSKQDTL